MEWSRPRSVRQVGSVPAKERIYIEDYVMRYVKDLVAQRRDGEKAAMLLGNLCHYNGEKMFRVSGVVEVPEFDKRNSQVFTTEMWDWIYTEMKENFTDLDIVGWFYTSPSFHPEDASKLLEIHKGNFRHRDKLLFIYEEGHEDEGMFLYRMGNFERQKGYYIYYEKNPEMLHYMEKENNRHVHVIEQEDDRVVRNIRGVMEDKVREKKKKVRAEQRRTRGVLAAVLVFAAFFFATTVKSQVSMEQLKGQLGKIQSMINGKEEKMETTVETIGGGICIATPGAVSASSISASAVSESTVAK